VLNAGNRRWLAPLLAAIGAAACASGAAADGEVVTRSVAEPAVAIRDYWTAERMRSAVPAGPLMVRGGHVAGRPKVPAETASPRTATDVSADSAAFPRRVHGRVFLTLGGSDYFCSATVVESAAHTVVWTAGHCLNGSDIGLGFAANWTFVPGYRDGQAPYGIWTATELLTTAAWRENANLRLDLGAAVLARDEQGRGIEDVVGARRITFDEPRKQVFEAYGYPAVDPNTSLFAPNFNGERLFSCISPRTATDRPPGSGPETLEIACDMTAGASGGSWVIDDRSVNSVTSYGYEFEPTHLYGPYLGSTAKGLYRHASGPPLLCAGRAVTNLGGPGPDSFVGGSGRDAFRLERAADQARGHGGRDVVCGGGGSDGLRGGGGVDRLRGQAGHELLVGGPGRDVCDGGPGRDAAHGCEVRRRIP
jgi:RTX calcium-binding nonapeptide repeat (4 copies)